MPLAGKRVRLEEEEQGSGMTNARPPQGRSEWCGLCDDEVRIRSLLAQSIPALRGRGMRIATPRRRKVRTIPNALAGDGHSSFRSLAPPLPIEPASLGFDWRPEWDGSQ